MNRGVWVVVWSAFMLGGCLTKPPPTGGTPGTGEVATTGQLDVTVRTFAGDPLPGARVSVPGASFTATTDAAGAVTLPALPPGPLLVDALAPGGIEVHARADIVAGERTPVVLWSPPVQALRITLDETQPTTVTLAGLTLTLPPGALRLPDGGDYRGAVDVRVANLLSDTFDAVPLPVRTTESGKPYTERPMLLLDVSLFTPDERPLQLDAGQQVAIRQEMPLDDEMLAMMAELDNRIALRRYEPVTGGWVDTGALTYAHGVVTGVLSHLSMYGAFSMASYQFEYSYSPRCKTGHIVADGKSVRSAIHYGLRISTRVGVVEVDTRLWTDDDGKFCIDVPSLGTTADVTLWTAAAPTRIQSVEFIVLKYVQVDGLPVPLPLHFHGGPWCGEPGYCPPVTDILHPSAQAIPACAITPSVCDDRNPCTTETCDPALCPGGTSCSGCRQVASAGACDDGNSCTVDDTCADKVCTGRLDAFGVAPGFPSPPVLTRVSEAMTLSLADSFDAAPREDLWSSKDLRGGAARTVNGRLVLVDDDPSPTADPLSFSLHGPLERDAPLTGPGHLQLQFVLPAAGRNASVSLRLGVSSLTSATVVLTRPGAGEPFNFYIQGDSGSTPVQTVTLATDTVHTLRLALDDTGQATATLFPAGGFAVVSTVAIQLAGWSVSLGVNGARESQVGEVPLLELEDFSSDVRIGHREAWTLSDSPLQRGGLAYVETSNLPQAPQGALWLSGPPFDARPLSEAGRLAPFLFKGTQRVNVYLVTATPPAQSSFHATLYSPNDETALRTFFANQGFTYTLDGKYQAFAPRADGPLWSVPTCP